MVSAGEMVVLAVAEIREGHVGKLVAELGERELQLSVPAPPVLLLQVPLAWVAPTETDGAARRHDLARSFIIGDGLPFGVHGLAQCAVEIARAHESLWHQPSVSRNEANEHRQVGIFPRVVGEVRNLPFDVGLAGNTVAAPPGPRPTRA